MHHKHAHYRHREFALSHRSLKLLRLVVFVFFLVLIYLLFHFSSSKVVTVLLALFILSYILQFFWMTHLERRIFHPLAELHEGVRQIADGNYSYKIDNAPSNEIGFLIDSFNGMASKLQRNETLQHEYEENRKALIANISHDLKTPVTAIQGYIEAIRDGLVTSPAKMDQYLEIINTNTVYINRLIDDLFLYSKLDLHQLEFCMERLPVRTFMEDLMAEFSFELEERGCSLHYTSDLTQDCEIMLDRKRMHQAIRNIIGNAVKYGPDADLKLDVRLYRQDDSVCLSIRDNGPGIPADKLPYIFDRFYRIDSERTKDVMSTGLGLSIAKELVEAHGGTIQAESTVGAGSCFTLTLPVCERNGDS